MNKSAFIRDIERAINKHGMESGCNTPDIILADFISGVLVCWDKATRRRDRWYGFATAGIPARRPQAPNSSEELPGSYHVCEPAPGAGFLQRSNCCNSSVRVGGSDGLTQWFECTKCGRPCDVRVCESQDTPEET